MQLPSKNLERKLFNGGYKTIAAVDEVGIGPLAGPVVVCAITVDRELFSKNVRRKQLLRLRDSKQLNAKQREAYFAYLTTAPEIQWSLAYSRVSTIDKINIYQATRAAMRRAIRKLSAAPDMVLVDGKTKIEERNIEQLAIVQGDRRIFSIACASLIAKVYRDRYMLRMAKKYPQYGFEKHKGYGTKLHMERLTLYGPCAIHRNSFKPVRTALKYE